MDYLYICKKGRLMETLIQKCSINTSILIDIFTLNTLKFILFLQKDISLA